MNLTLKYIKRTFLSYRFIISLIGIVIISVCGMYYERSSSGTVHMFSIMMGLSTYRKLMVIFAAYPFGMVYCNECRSGYNNFVIVRSNVVKSLRTYIIVQFIISFTVVFAGMLISIGIVSLKAPFYIHSNSVLSTFFYETSLSKCITYILFSAFIYSLSIAAWSMSGLMMSSIFLNNYVAICSPLVFSYVTEIFTVNSSIFPDLWRLSLGYTEISDNPVIALIYITIIFCVLALIFSFIFFNVAKRRAHNEIC